MTLNLGDKRDLATCRLDRAEALMKDAQILLDASSCGSSANRSYYAMLSAARALLVLRGISADSCEGIKTMISQEFVKPGLLPKEMGEAFGNLQARRMDSDYADYVEITEAEGRDSLAKAERFIAEAKRLCRSILEG